MYLSTHLMKRKTCLTHIFKLAVCLAIAFSLLPLLLPSLSIADLNENCTVSVLNRTAQVKADGSYVIPNVPSNMGLVRVRATCVENGVTRSGQSDWLAVPTSQAIYVGGSALAAFAPT